VAQVAGAFGVRGEVRVTAFTQDPASLLGYGALLDGSGKPTLTLVSGRADKGAFVGRAREVATREEAQAMRGVRLYIPRHRLPAPEEDEFYLADLIGLAAVSATGEALGRVKSVHNFGAGDLLEIEPPGGAATWWAPFTKQVVPEVRLTEGVLLVDRPAEIDGGSGGEG
jgi:16S rRNA processing protein RimM